MSHMDIVIIEILVLSELVLVFNLCLTDDFPCLNKDLHTCIHLHACIYIPVFN